MTLPAGLEPIIRHEMAAYPVQSHDPAQGLPLQVTTFGADEVLEALESMLSTYVTMGNKVRAFEAAWAKACHTRHGVMVNSGSSANLLLWAALVATGRLQPGDEVLVPAVGWSTTLFPVVQNGLTAVLVDVDPHTLCIDPAAARRAITPKTRAVFPVHLLGCPAPMHQLAELGLLVLEDACAAHGARWHGEPVGGLGHAGTFSFFFSHHITTMEGGILVTNDDELADAARSLRAHGWIREMQAAPELARAHPDTDPRFLFVTPGYNLRPTELAGAFGLHQLGRLPGFVARRRANHQAWCGLLQRSGLPLSVFPEPEGALHSGFAFPLLIHPDAPYPRRALLEALERRHIATRSISGGNLARQPATQRLSSVRVPHHLPVADAIHERGFFVGNSHAFDVRHGQMLLDALTEFHHDEGHP